MVEKTKTINRDLTFPLVYGKKYTRNVLGGWTYQGQEAHGPFTGMSSLVRDYVSRTYGTLAGWKTLRDTQGWLPTNPLREYRHNHSQMNTAGGIFMAINGNTKIERDYSSQQIRVMSLGPGYLSTQGEQDGVIDPAKSRCLAKVRDMKVNVAVALAEGRQTVRMIAETAQKLGTAYQAFRKGNLKRAARVLGIKKPVGEAANHWLAYGLGWRPLVGDLKGLAELAAQQLELGGRGPRMKAVSYNSSSASVNQVTVTNQGSSWSVRGDYRVRGGWTYQAKAGLVCELEYTSAALAAQVGFGLWDPLSTAWELTPFSFVFDYVIDVGTWLEESSSLQGWKVVTGFTSLSQEFRGDQTWENLKVHNASGFAQPATMTRGSPRVPFRQRWHVRAAWTGSAPSIKAPLWDGLNARRITTIGALMKQLTAGDRTKGGYKP